MYLFITNLGDDSENLGMHGLPETIFKILEMTNSQNLDFLYFGSYLS